MVIIISSNILTNKYLEELGKNEFFADIYNANQLDDDFDDGSCIVGEIVGMRGQYNDFATHNRIYRNINIYIYNAFK